MSGSSHSADPPRLDRDPEFKEFAMDPRRAPPEPSGLWCSVSRPTINSGWNVERSGAPGYLTTGATDSVTTSRPTSGTLRRWWARV